MTQLSLLDAPIIIESTRVPAIPKPKPTPQLTVGDLVVPKRREGHTPLFVEQVCEVVKLGQSLGRERVFAVPVKWKGRGVPAAPFGRKDLFVLSGGERDYAA